jgi:hypothetical protein
MSNYHTIQTTEVRQVVFTVFADTQEEALEIANEDYNAYQHEWDSIDVSFNPIGGN